MDKRKVIIIGAGSQHLSIARALGEAMHAEVVKTGFVGLQLQGKRPDILILDDLEFSDIEARLIGMQDMVRDPDAGTVTGRLSRQDPEFQELSGVHELHSRAWDELLAAIGADRQTIKDLTFLERYSSYDRWPMVRPQLDQIPRKPEKSRYFASPYGVNNTGADHPSRKREPKGPRGKWGKVK